MLPIWISILKLDHSGPINIWAGSNPKFIGSSRAPKAKSLWNNNNLQIEEDDAGMENRDIGPSVPSVSHRSAATSTAKQPTSCLPTRGIQYCSVLFST